MREEEQSSLVQPDKSAFDRWIPEVHSSRPAYRDRISQQKATVGEGAAMIEEGGRCGVRQGKRSLAEVSSLGKLDDIALRGIISQELLDQVDVGEHHAAAAVAVEAELIHGVAVEHDVSL